ncbi:putative nesprin-1 [Apostichopus japonicus]|uniref:Putative nesprin-1 n=1 Tax=Stichopus japonicus TaxID=307972 RepID=A0A2G8KQT3_STIJA|nr:putative nesprin-1 [Apostichopus japonicus]
MARSHHQKIVQDINSRKVPVSDVTVHAEQFLKSTRDKLTPELQNELQGSVGDLRTTYERLLGTSMDWLKDAKDLLDRLKREKDETMSVEAKIRSLQERLNGLSDWITEMERQLGSEQPMEENLQPLNRQNQDHDALHENIQSKQEDTVSVVQDTESLLRQYPDRIDQVLQSQLRGQATDLKSRYGWSATSHRTEPTDSTEP